MRGVADQQIPQELLERGDALRIFAPPLGRVPWPELVLHARRFGDRRGPQEPQPLDGLRRVRIEIVGEGVQSEEVRMRLPDAFTPSPLIQPERWTR